MTKIVVLTIKNGSYENGFSVRLEIGEASNSPDAAGAISHFIAQTSGFLPPKPEIIDFYNSWLLKTKEINNKHPNILRIKAKKGKAGNQNEIATQQINEWIESASLLRDCFKEWLNSSSNDWKKTINFLQFSLLNPQEEIRVFIKTNDPKLKKLPWNEWDIFSNIYTNSEIALSPPQFSRVFASPNTFRTKVRVLGILGDSAGINIEVDKQAIAQLPNTEYEILEQPEPRVVFEKIRDEQGWDILFYAGHSKTEDEVGEIYLSKDYKLKIDELKQALRKAIEQGLQLAIFNSCEGLGLASQLADLNMPQVIVMREPVPDKAAQTFLTNFLQAFSEGEALYLAVRKARESLKSLDSKYPGVSWFPVICQNPAQAPVSWRYPASKRKNSNSLPVVSKKTWQCQRILTGHTARVKSIAISPDREIIASGSSDETVKLWDLATGELLHTFTGHRGRVTCVAFSPDGQTLASSSEFKDGTIKLWDVKNRKLKATLKGDDWFMLSVMAIAFSRDGKYLASAHRFDSTVKLWSLESGKQLHTFRGHFLGAECVAFNRADGTLISGGFDSNIKIWCPQTKKLLRTLNGPQGRFSGIRSWFSDDSIYCIAVSLDGKMLASSGGQGSIKLWYLPDEKLIHTLKGHVDSVYSVAFSNDGLTLASASADNNIHIWDVQSGKLLNTLSQEDNVYSVAFSRDGESLVCGNEDKTIKIYQFHN